MAKFSVPQFLSAASQIATGAMQGHQAGLQQRRANENDQIAQALQIAQIQQGMVDRQQAQAFQQQQGQADILSRLLPNLTGPSQQEALGQILALGQAPSASSPLTNFLNLPLVQRKFGGLTGSVGAAPPIPGVASAPPTPAPMAGGMTPPTNAPQAPSRARPTVGGMASGLQLKDPETEEDYKNAIEYVRGLLTDPKNPVRDRVQREELTGTLSILTRSRKAGTPLSELGLNDIFAKIQPPPDPKLDEERRQQEYDLWKFVREQRAQHQVNWGRVYGEIYNSPGVRSLPLAQRDRHARVGADRAFPPFSLNTLIPEGVGPPGGIPGTPAAAPATPDVPVPAAVPDVAGAQPYPEIYDAEPYRELQDTLAGQAGLKQAPAPVAAAPAAPVEEDLPGVLTPEEKIAREKADRDRRQAEKDEQRETELFPLRKRQLQAGIRNAENQPELEKLRLLMQNRNRNDRIAQQNISNDFRMEMLRLSQERQQNARISGKVDEATKLRLSALNRDATDLLRRAQAAASNFEDDLATDLLYQASALKDERDSIIAGLGVEVDTKTAVENAISRWEQRHGQKASQAIRHKISRQVRGTGQ